MAALQGDDLGKPVVMGRKTFVSIGRPLPGRTNIVVTRDAGFRAAGVVVTHFRSRMPWRSPPATRCGVSPLRSRSSAARRSTRNGWTGADRLEITEVHARPEGDTRFAAIDAARWEEVARVRNPAGPDDSADFSYVTFRRRTTALTALTNVCIDNYGLKHSCFEPEACVVRDLAVPYKAGRICEAGHPAQQADPGPAEESFICRGRIKAGARGARVPRDRGARVRSRSGRGRPISRTFCGAARTGCSSFCRAVISAAWASHWS